MDGVYINKPDNALEAGLGAVKLKLLAKGDGVEIMTQTLVPGATVWVIPADDSEALEFFFVSKGEIELTIYDQMHCLGPGDSFYVCDLKNELLLKSRCETELLYITNRAMFDSVFGFQDDLTRLIMQIDEKDHYTFRHSRNVMHYSMRLFENLRDYCPDVHIEDVAVSSLFHDVGKCFVPDEILKKPAGLLPGELRYIMRHPTDSERLLKPHFGQRVAETAKNHHERLDGSGYPRGLTAEDIFPEARIVAVADAFDAMTTERGYNKKKTFEEAAVELYGLDKKFDRRVTETLLELIRSGKLTEVNE